MTETLAAAARSALQRQPEGIYLNTAAEGLPLASAQSALSDYLDAKSRGSRGRPQLDDIADRGRARLASTIGADPSDIAFIASTSRGLDVAIKSIDWQPGNNVVTLESEFPTALFSAELLRRRGVEVRLVQGKPSGISQDDVVAQIDGKTRLVIVSAVSFKTGQHMHVDLITAHAHSKGALVFVDAVQAVGAVPTEVGDVDFLCAATFKWMLGIHGVAGLYVSARARDRCRAPYVGYRSVSELFPPDGAAFSLRDDACRFEEGMPNFAAIAVMGSALAQLHEWGLDNIFRHNQELIHHLNAGLARLGARILNPDPALSRGSVLSFASARYADIARELGAGGTAVWARDGRVRLSPHVYNTLDDIDDVLGQLATIGVDE